jgi:phytoene dehydrogenase-like protein
MSKKVVIIGGGVAGLSAGIYAAANGFDTQILEMHTVAGGQCTAWKRKGYTFDYCLHWLVGTSTGAFHEIWKETNVLNDETTVINHDIHSCIIDESGNEFIVYANIDRWEKYLLEMAPEDARSIKMMCNDMRKSGVMESFSPISDVRSFFKFLKNLPQFLPLFDVFRKYGKMTCSEYFKRLNFSNERILSVFASMYGDRDFSALAFIFMLGWFHKKNAGYIKGGSFPLAQRMAATFKQLGGELSFGKKVEKIVVENNQAKGVLLTDGSRIAADYVISAADGYATIFRMLDGGYVSDEIAQAYTQWKLFTPIVQVSFGINQPITSKAVTTSYMFKQAVIGKTKLESGFSIMNYAFDSTMAPEGKTTLVLRYESPWNLWEGMGEAEYVAEKSNIQQDATAFLSTIYPGISEHIEVVDVATPITDVRYTGVREGAYEGFMPSAGNIMKSLKMQLPGLRNFYMAGQWLYPGGGLPPSAQSGKLVVKRICKKEKQAFSAPKSGR